MRRLIGGMYKIIFRITGSKLFSLAAALVYISILNLIIIYGLCLLLTGWLPEIGIATRLFTFPYYILLGALMVGINFYIMLPLQNLSKDKGPISVVPIVIYTVASAMLLLYTHFF